MTPACRCGVRSRREDLAALLTALHGCGRARATSVDLRGVAGTPRRRPPPSEYPAGQQPLRRHRGVADVAQRVTEFGEHAPQQRQRQADHIVGVAHDAVDEPAAKAVDGERAGHPRGSPVAQ